MRSSLVVTIFLLTLPGFAPAEPPPDLTPAQLALDDKTGRLNKFEEGTRQKDSESRRASPPPSTDGTPFWNRTESHHEDDDDNFCSELLGDLLFKPIGDCVVWFFASNWIRYELPYAAPKYAFARPCEEADSGFALDLRADGQRVAHDLWAWHLGGHVRLPNRLNIDMNYTQYIEDMGGRNDHLHWETYTLSTTLLAGRRYYTTVGIGAAILTGDASQGGVCFQGELDVFPVDPLIVHLRARVVPMTWATLTELEGGVGLNVDRFEFTAGWRAFINSNAPDLSGPFLGIGVSF